MLEPHQKIKIDEAGDQRGSSLDRLSLIINMNFYLICWQESTKNKETKSSFIATIVVGFQWCIATVTFQKEITCVMFYV